MTNLQRILYAAGQLGMMGLTRFVFQWVIKFASTEGPDGSVLLSAAAVGAVFLGFRIFDGITDPIAGVVSDGWIRKGRERRTLLWYSFALPPIGLALCFLPDHSMTEALRWTLVVAGLFVFFVGYTFYAIPYWSLIEDYSAGEDNRRRVLSTVLGAGLLLATGIGFVVSPGLVEAHGYLVGALAFAVPGGLLMVLPYFAKPSDAKLSVPEQTGEKTSLLRSLKIALGHRRFLSVLVLFSGSQMSFTIMTAAAPFIAEDLLGGTVADVALLLGPLLGTAIPCFIFVPRLSRAIGWERGLLFASLALGVVYLTAGGLGRAVIGTPLVTAMIIFGLGGPMCSVLLGLEGEAITACAKERGSDVVSTYFGVFNFIVKALNGVAMLLAGTLAELSRGDLGVVAVRLMAFSAASCLFICSITYFIIRPRSRVEVAP